MIFCFDDSPEMVVANMAVPLIAIACLMGHWMGWEFGILCLVLGILAAAIGAMLGDCSRKAWKDSHKD